MHDSKACQDAQSTACRAIVPHCGTKAGPLFAAKRPSLGNILFLIRSSLRYAAFVNSLTTRLDKIRRERDQNRKNLLVAEVVSELLRAIGTEPVVVGGSAVEFYTDGAYVSGDVDLCFDGTRLPTPRERETVLAAAGQPVGIRAWNVAGVLVDLLGRLETSARSPLQRLGAISLIQIEDLIAERLLIATVPQFDAERWRVAKVLLAAGWKNLVALDRAELRRIAKSPAYQVGDELERMIREIEGAQGSGGEETKR